MTTLANHQSNRTTKMLLLGDSGAGKTGATACLAKDYRIIYADFDNGLDILRNLLVKAGMQEAMGKSVFYKSFTDDMEWKGTTLVPKSARAFQECMKALTSKWTEDDASDLGNVYSWGPDTILVIDGLTRACKAAKHLILSLNGRLADRMTQSDWGDAQDEIENFISLLTSPSVKCNVILMAHIDEATDPITSMKKLYPMALGQKLPPKIPGYFNTMLVAKTKGLGNDAKRIIRTTNDGSLAIKYPMLPGTLPPELPIDSGLATFFKAARESDPTPKAAA